MESNSRLKYFTSVPINEHTEEPLSALEDILQQEHGVDGKHPSGTESQSGFITPDLVRKINLMWDSLQKR